MFNRDDITNGGGGMERDKPIEVDEKAEHKTLRKLITQNRRMGVKEGGNWEDEKNDCDMLYFHLEKS